MDKEIKQRLEKLLLSSAEYALSVQKKDGTFPVGHNGPWNDRETPIRTSSHWIIVLLEAHTRTKKKKYLDAALHAAELFFDEKYRPNSTFYCRDGKNQCNGLIGQAWALEALLALTETTRKKKYFAIALDVVMNQPFDVQKKLWYVLETDNTVLGVNRTLNQQIWFGVMAFRVAKIARDKTLEKRARAFFANIEDNAVFLFNTFHHIMHPLAPLIMREETRGYASFILMGLAMAYATDKKLVSLSLRRKIVKALKKIPFTQNTKYSWSYNPTGFEIAYAMKVFNVGLPAERERWIEKQLTYAVDIMNKNTTDKNILAARVYESRLL